jgi:hypothetical protein
VLRERDAFARKRERNDDFDLSTFGLRHFLESIARAPAGLFVERRNDQAGAAVVSGLAPSARRER